MLGIFTTLSAQDKSTHDFWKNGSDALFRSNLFEREIIPNKYETFTFDPVSAQQYLSEGLNAFRAGDRENFLPFYLPTPNGKTELYYVRKDNLVPEKLNRKYPEIAVYAGYAASDPTKTLRMDFTDKGFRAVSYSPDQETFFIDPIAKGVKNTVMSYYKKDYSRKQDFECLVEDVISKEEGHEHNHDHDSPQRSVGDCQLHTFELALACTAEYAAFHGGTVNSVMAEFVTSINRINGLFETELGVNFVFVPNTDQLIFFNANTDPYSNNDGGAMLGQNQQTCDQVIGSSNYDVGHVYSTGGGGIARLNAPCNNNAKAQGVTGLPSPVGDPFYVDFVAHEIGHQFGGTHSYNNSCGGQRSNSAAFEPGSGSTIMAYAGICTPNVQFQSDAYFHTGSSIQIANFLSGVNCQTRTANGSDRPNISTLQDYIIPISTPFELVAEATVNDGSSLTYCWEQTDTDIANMPPETNATDGPSFRSLTPTVSGSRYFPSLPFLLGNADNPWEVLPGAARDLNFTVTVRGAAPGQAGCKEDAQLELTVSNAAGPFEVISPNTNVTWTVGETENVSWQVANTNNAPVNCANVDILLSLDGGFTYPITLLENTPNDGSADIMVPNNEGSQNRIRVSSVGNVFFDVSNREFTIVAPVVPTFSMTANPFSQSVCGSTTGTVSYELITNGLSGFNQEVSLTASGLPNGVQANFSNNNSIPNAISTINLSGLENVPSGSYTFTVEGNGGNQSASINLDLEVFDSSPAAAILTSPANTADLVNLSTTLSWDAVDFAESYIVEVSDNPSFDNILYTTTVDALEASPTGLNSATVYYWRVQASNICGSGSMSEIFRFRTGEQACTTYTNNTPVNIPAANTGTVTSQLNISGASTIESMTVSTTINHSYVADLAVELISPQGASINLFDQPGIPASNFGCALNNIQATFDDEAVLTAEDFENTCNAAAFAIQGTYQSIDPLSTFNGINPNGNWTFELADNFAEDGGEISSWSMEICSSTGSSAAPMAANNSPLTVEQSETKNISSQELLFTGTGAPADFVFTLISLPNSGTLSLNGTTLQIGDTFTQADIDNGSLSYTHNGDAATSDSFVFDTVETNGGWAPNNTFQITIIEMNFSGMAQQSNVISCFGGNDGAISVTPVGGQAPFMYSLNGTNFQTSNTFNNLAAGVYTITIADNDSNTTTTNMVTIAEPNEIVVSATVNQNNVSISAAGGTGSLTYSIDNINFQNDAQFDNLANGDYTFYIRDQNNCVVSTMTVTVLINDLTVTSSLTSTLSCFAGNDATISVNVSGGTLPFNYTLNGGAAQNSNIFANLTSGTYTVLVTDANGFSESSNTITIQDPTELMLTLGVLGNEITATGNGGTGALQYSIDGINFQNANIFSNLANGNYTIYLRDANSCIITQMAIIDIEALSATATITNEILCNGDATAALVINASGGTAPYQYAFDTNFQNSNVYENLSAGSYTFSVFDINNQMTSVNVTINEPTALSLQVGTNEDEATLNVQGGTAPYQYSVDNAALQSSPIFTNLDEGNHTARIIDANNCELSASFTISISAIVAQVTETSSIACNGDLTGAFTINATGGILPYEYSIDGNTFQASNTFANLGADNYTILVRDADGRNTSINYNLTEPDALSLSTLVQNDVITINADGGTAPYMYTMIGGNLQSGNQFFNLADGEYTFEVRDANNCTETIMATVTFTPLNGTSQLTQEIDCAGNDSAEIEAIATGGIAPYSYSLDGISFQSQSVFTNLGSGIYTIIIRDNNGIEFSTNTISISEPTQIIVSIDQNDREITATAAGGTGALTYSIDGINFQPSNTFSNLQNGDYTLYVRDSRNCEITLDFNILVNDIIGITSIAQQITCHDANDGIIAVESSGGTAPRQFSIDNGATYQTDNFFENLSAGSYTVIVRDATGLTEITNTVVIVNASEININVAVVDNSATINASGGTGALTYSIDGVDFSGNNSFEMLLNGPYTAYVRDGNDCEVTTAFTVDIADLFGSFTSIGENLCAGDQSVSISLMASGGIAPYTYALDGQNFDDNNLFQNLGAGTYTPAVQDASGTIFRLPIIDIEDPAILTLVSQVEADAVSLTAQGGTMPYQYSIDGTNFQNSEVFSNLQNGNYTATVRDANACEATVNFSIEITAPLALNIEVIDILDCEGLIAGNIQASGTGGTPPYQFSLNGAPFQSSGLFENIGPGSYQVTLRDATMANTSSPVTLTAQAALELDIIIDGNDVEIDVFGGIAPYTFSLDGGQSFSSSRFYTDLEVGDYEVIVEDASGCTIFETFSIIATSVSQIDQDLIFALQPNPAHDVTSLTLDAANAQDIQIRLIDILGRTVRTYDANQANGNQYEIQLNQIVPGTYLIRVDIDGRTAVKKLVVQ